VLTWVFPSDRSPGGRAEAGPENDVAVILEEECVRPTGLRGGYRSLQASVIAAACVACLAGAAIGAVAGVPVVDQVTGAGAASPSSGGPLGTPHPATGSPVTVAVIVDAGAHVAGTGALVAQGA
jgi:hypothetical protein